MSSLHVGEFKVGYAVTAMPIRYAIERQQWADAAQLEPVAGAQPQVLAITRWARAIGLARSGEPAAARKELEQIETAHQKLREGGDDYWATQVHVQANEARAWMAHAEGKEDEAVNLMRDAADEEDAVEKRPVTPGAIIPAREQLGYLLLDLNRAPEALTEFQTILRIVPQRRAALIGKARARELVAAGNH
jgi:hypothetical protein